MKRSEIWQWQEDMRARPRVYCVFIKADGEENLAGIYEDKESAQMHVSYWNSRSRWEHGRAHMRSEHIVNMELAKRRFDA